MNAHPLLQRWAGEGEMPLPSAPSPKTTLGRLHKTLDTPSTANAKGGNQPIILRLCARVALALFQADDVAPL